MGSEACLPHHRSQGGLGVSVGWTEAVARPALPNRNRRAVAGLDGEAGLVVHSSTPSPRTPRVRHPVSVCRRARPWGCGQPSHG